MTLNILKKKTKEEKIEEKEYWEDKKRRLTKLDEQFKELEENNVGDSLERKWMVKPSAYRTYEKIKKEFNEYFDKESGNTPKKGIKEVEGYVKEDKDRTDKRLTSINLLEKELEEQKVDNSDSLYKEKENKPSKKVDDLSTTNKVDEDKSSSLNKNLSLERSNTNPNPEKETPTEYVESLSQTEMPSYIDTDDKKKQKIFVLLFNLFLKKNFFLFLYLFFLNITIF